MKQSVAITALGRKSEKPPAPLKKDENVPEFLAVIGLAGEMFGKKDSCISRIKEAIALTPLHGQKPLGPPAKFSAEPPADRHPESVLLAVNDVIRKFSFHRLFQEILRRHAVQLVRVRQTARELDNATIEEGCARLKRREHACAIDLDQDLIHHVRSLIHPKKSIARIIRIALGEVRLGARVRILLPRLTPCVG